MHHDKKNGENMDNSVYHNTEQRFGFGSKPSSSEVFTQSQLTQFCIQGKLCTSPDFRQDNLDRSHWMSNGDLVI